MEKPVYTDPGATDQVAFDPDPQTLDGGTSNLYVSASVSKNDANGADHSFPA